MMMPLALGIIATVLAAIRLVTWTAVGFWVAGADETPATVPFTLLVGAGVTGCCYAVAAFAGHLTLGLTIDGCIAVAGCGSHRRELVRAGRQMWTALRAFLSHGRWWSSAVTAWTTVAWLVAIAPPRDADVLRYHLGHVHQIVMDGRWSKIVDTAYAMPFGWSLTYLPFEVLGVPQAAHLLALGVWIVVVAAVQMELRGRDSVALRLLLLALSCQPMVFKAVTTAHADAYTMLVMAVVALQVQAMCGGDAGTVRRASLTTRGAIMLGFAAWIGAQARYQAIGIGVAAMLVLAGCAARRLVRLRLAAAAVGGGVLALALATPFYAANALWFGDPVWPLLARAHAGAASGADRVAAEMAARMSAPLAWHLLPEGLSKLAIDVSVFPIPLVLALALVAGWWMRRTRALAAFTTCYLVIWACVEPLLYPRFVIFLVPVVPLLAADALRWLAGARAAFRRVLTLPLASFAAAAVAAAGLYAADSVRYDVTGDRVGYDRATWFAPVYRWANASTPHDARFLVVVKSGSTYLLARRSRPADPENSAEIDWAVVPDGRALSTILGDSGYQYVIYEDRDWNLYPGGARMTAIVRDAIARGGLVPAASFSLRLVTSRLLGRSVPSRVRVLTVACDSAQRRGK